jgi:hypothetical protein
MSKFDTFYWRRQSAIDSAIISRCLDAFCPGSVVVDVGAGYDPWHYANEFVDNAAWPALAGKKVHIVDVEFEPLPFADKSVDFLYCRHTIEDLSCPFLLLSEIRRVAKAGYIETPSPMAEFARGIDRGAGHRGYAHHRWFVWVDEHGLNLMPKFPSVEFVDIGDSESTMDSLLAAQPGLWNSYLPWRGSFGFRTLRHPTDFKLGVDYSGAISKAIEAGHRNAGRFIREFGLESARFIGTPSNQPNDHE